jgi:large subunit ribosomal protein L35
MITAFSRNIMKKTHKGIAKRFKLTGTGKVMFRKPGQRHLRRKRSVKQVRAGRQDQVLADGMARRVIRALSV